MSSLGKIVSKTAPVLGNVLNAFLPGSGLVLSGLLSLFGVKTQDELENAIKTDPESAIKLKQFELTHIEELERIAAQDRNSARNMAIEIAKATGSRDWVQNFIAIFLMVSFFSIVLIVLFTKMDKTDHDVLYILAGQFSGAFLLVVSFYFGSSTAPKMNYPVSASSSPSSSPPSS